MLTGDILWYAHALADGVRAAPPAGWAAGGDRRATAAADQLLKTLRQADRMAHLVRQLARPEGA